MLRPSVSLLGRAEVRIGDEPRKITPRATAVLTRLVLADGEPLTVDEIYRAVWSDGAAQGQRVTRENRGTVQKCVLELRGVLERGRPEGGPPVLVTEQGSVTTYRLALDRADVDLHHFRDLVERARQESAVNAVNLLRQALGMWRGRPLVDTENYAFTKASIHSLGEMHHAASLELMEAYSAVGLPAEALRLGEDLIARYPADPVPAERVRYLRKQLAGRWSAVDQRTFSELSTRVTIVTGDLFAQQDAQLVIGFSDTFDTSTERSLIINRGSVQGQFLHRVYDGDVRQLNQDLRNALRRIEPSTVEQQQAKPHGKRTRYPVGTVAVLHRGGRRYLGVAYSVMGNDLIARSDLDMLRLGLDGVWTAALRKGQREPLAVPLLGSGLARIDGVDGTQLLKLLIDSFVRRSRDEVVSRELRVVLRPEDLEGITMLDVAAFLSDL